MSEDQLVLDCQADLLSGLNTRVIVPLLEPAQLPKPIKGLNPVFDIGGSNYVMATQFAATIQVRQLGDQIASLHAHDAVISKAFDMLLTGY